MNSIGIQAKARSLEGTSRWNEVGKMNRALKLLLLPGAYAVCRLRPDAGIPEWASSGDIYSITRTPEELSIVCAESALPHEVLIVERGWRVLKLGGPFPFEMTGVLASVLDPLAAAGVSILAVATYDTDYVFVKDDQCETAIAVLSEAGHDVTRAAEAWRDAERR